MTEGLRRRQFSSELESAISQLGGLEPHFPNEDDSY